MIMKTYLMALALLSASAGAAFAQPEEETLASSELGASVALEGSEAMANGDVVAGSVAMPSAAASVGVASVVGTTEAVTSVVGAPLQASFGTEPLAVTGVTVRAQPAPNVPTNPPAAADTQ
jgi:hypothetical protein